MSITKITCTLFITFGLTFRFFDGFSKKYIFWVISISFATVTLFQVFTQCLTEFINKRESIKSMRKKIDKGIL